MDILGSWRQSMIVDLNLLDIYIPEYKNGLNSKQVHKITIEVPVHNSNSENQISSRVGLLNQSNVENYNMTMNQVMNFVG
jgi:hypothetical protein